MEGIDIEIETATIRWLDEVNPVFVGKISGSPCEVRVEIQHGKFDPCYCHGRSSSFRGRWVSEGVFIGSKMHEGWCGIQMSRGEWDKVWGA